jgi:hypothetical protein
VEYSITDYKKTAKTPEALLESYRQHVLLRLYFYSKGIQLPAPAKQEDGVTGRRRPVDTKDEYLRYEYRLPTNKNIAKNIVKWSLAIVLFLSWIPVAIYFTTVKDTQQIGQDEQLEFAPYNYNPLYYPVAAFNLLFSVTHFVITFRIPFEEDANNLIMEHRLFSLMTLIVFGIRFVVFQDNYTGAIMEWIWSVMTCMIFVSFPVCMDIVLQKREPKHVGWDCEMTKESFGRLLKDELMYDQFKKFVSKQLNLENILFMEEYHKILSQIPSLKRFKIPIVDPEVTFPEDVDVPAHLAADVQRIYWQYIVPGSPNELNLIEIHRAPVEQQVLSRNLHPFILKKVYDYIFELLFQNSYQNFVTENRNRKPKPKRTRSMIERAGVLGTGLSDT